MFDTLISAAELSALLAQSTLNGDVATLAHAPTSGAPVQPSCAVFDCSFDLARPGLGQEQFAQGHVAGARYAHLDEHLSCQNPNRAASGGRHPLPLMEDFTAWLRACGVGPGTQVVVLDRNGNNYCGRMWWMLQASGHTCAVLDGGWAAWLAANGAVETGWTPLPAPLPALSSENPQNTHIVQYPRHLFATKTIATDLGKSSLTLIDARAPARFRGEVEPLDPVAGHIPGALNRPFAANMGADGLFKNPDQLRQEFENLLGGRDPKTVVHHCGSGVSAIPNVLAMRIAGMGTTGLYAGSWSEWCNTPGLPVAKG